MTATAITSLGEVTEVTEKAKRRTFPVEYKRRIVKQADACKAPGEIGALLRREGLYSSQLATWRGATDVSLSRVVVTGLSFGSDYCFTLAAKWLEQGFPVDGEVARVVDARSSDRSLSQEVRHSAVGIVRRWERKSHLSS